MILARVPAGSLSIKFCPSDVNLPNQEIRIPGTHEVILTQEGMGRIRLYMFINVPESVALSTKRLLLWEY